MVLSPAARRLPEPPQHVDGTYEAAALGARPGDHLPAGRIDHLAEAVDGHQRAHDQAAPAGGQGLAGRAHASLQTALHPQGLAHRSPRARADAPLRDGARPRRSTGAIAGLGIRAHVAPAETEVVEDSAHHDGHRPGAVHKADAPLLQVAHDAAGRVEAPGAAARQDDGVDRLDQRAGPQGVGLAGAGGAAAHVDAAHGPLLAEDDGAAGGGAPVRPVPDADAGHVGDGVTDGSTHDAASSSAWLAPDSSGWHLGQKWVLRPATFTRAISPPQT